MFAVQVAAFAIVSHVVASRGIDAEVTPGVLSRDEMEQLLDQHNFHRSNIALGAVDSEPAAANMNMLFWDEGLAEIATAWVAQCEWAHNPDRADQLDMYKVSFEFDEQSRGVGENAYFTTGAKATVIDRLVGGVDSWFSEMKYFDYDANACIDDEDCGHYTQTVWAGTRYVGCGYAQCGDELRMFCNYFPSGNAKGQQPYVEGTAGSACPIDRTPSKETGLCAGCQSSYGGFCEDDPDNSCSIMESFCAYGGECTLSNSYSLCTGCRTTCGTCTDVLTDSQYQQCTDGLGNDVSAVEESRASVYVHGSVSGLLEEESRPVLYGCLAVAGLASLFFAVYLRCSSGKGQPLTAEPVTQYGAV